MFLGTKRVLLRQSLINPALALLRGGQGFAFDAPSKTVAVKDETNPTNNFVGSINDAISSGILIYSRASTGTYIGSDGLMKTAVSGEPRFTYDPITFTPLGYLAEPQATNLALWSEQLDNAAVSKVAATVSPNAANAPDGNLTADKIQEDNTVSTHYVAPPALTCVSGTTYSFSTFVKAAERGFSLFVMAGSSFPLAGITVDLSTGTVGTAIGSPLSAKSEKAANGFWRISFSLAATATAADNIISVRASLDGVWANRSYQGVAGSGIYAWGIQPEASGAATSYIPTVGSTVTRSGDLLLVNMDKIPTLPSAYSIIAKGRSKRIGSTCVLFALTNSSTPTFNNCVYLTDSGTATTVTGLTVRSSATSYNLSRNGLAYNADDSIQIAARLKAGNTAFSLNGSSTAVGATTVLPSIAMDRLSIGQDWGLSGTSANGWKSTISSVCIIPRELSDTEIIMRSTP